jgi:hypothetical protein
VYISVAHGKKIKPSSGQIKVLKVALIRTGWTIHQIKNANLGPNVTRAMKKQHMASS